MPSQSESFNVMDQLSAEMVAEFPERGMQWVKDRVETVVNETGEYVREKPTQSLFYALAVGYVLNRLPVRLVIGGLIRLLLFALKPAALIYGAAKLYQVAQQRE
jgi:predicted nucleic-acid-binding protein